MTAITLTKANERTSRPACRRCGSEGNKGFYWAVSSATGRKVMIERNAETIAAKQDALVSIESIHPCFRFDAGLPTETETEHNVIETIETTETETNEEHNVVIEQSIGTEAVSADEMAAFRKLLQQIIGQPQIDADEVKRIARDVIEGMVMPERVIIVKDNHRREVEGVVHKQMEDVLDAIASGRNVQLVGGPGVGKTHMCEQVAEMVDREFYCIGFHLQSTASELRGFMSPNGDFVWTVVYEWAKNPDGGILLTDELDRSHPGIQAALNSLLSNRFITFPNRETVKLTKRHVIVGATNTFGDGATWEFPAAQKFSAEFKDRFITIEIEIDERVEEAAAMAEGAPLDVTQRVLSYVRKVRANVKREAIEGVLVTPRASQNMAALLAQGVEWDKAVRWTLRKGMEDEDWRKVA